MATSSISYSSDAPLQDPKLDRFDREPFARRIAETLARREDPSSMVIAIYGAWGDGKTTVLNFIRDRLEKEGAVICVNFNPWRLDGEDALLASFFSTLAEALDTELKTTAQKIGDLLKQYSFILKPVPIIKELEPLASGAGSMMSSVSLDRLRSQISSILRASKKRVVVMIDDIDRLEKIEIQAIFRLVKLTADFDNVAYVLAFDEEMVAAAIGERYSADATQHSAAGKKFIEKIVQVGLYLPSAGAEELREYAFDQINEALRVSNVDLPQDQATEFSINFLLGPVQRIRTPRMAKRYGNALQFSLGILKGEIRSADLMMIEGVRSLYPQLYLAIRDSKMILLTGGPEGETLDLEDFVRKNNPPLSADEARGVIRAIQSLFPRTKKHVIYDSQWDNEWGREKRICAKDYFDRYFSYAIRSCDVSDSDIEDLLDSGRLKQEEFTAKFRSLITSKNASVFVSKLRNRENGLKANIVQRIGVAIASSSHSLPSAAGLAGVSRPFVQSAIFIAQSLKCVPEVKRMAIATRVMEAAEAPAFVAECMRWMSTSDGDESRIFDTEKESELRSRGAEVILSLLGRLEAPIFSADPEATGNILFAVQWGLGNDKARGYVSKWIAAEPSSAITLIRAYKGKGTSMETGLPVETPFFRQQYDAIVALADADAIIKALTIVYGKALARDADTPLKNADELKLARQFLAIHKNVRESQNSTTLPPAQPVYQSVPEIPKENANNDSAIVS